jgi:NAD(P)-dependent dehydrogenase (short-subunit alcohol dehydrogenase family)
VFDLSGRTAVVVGTSPNIGGGIATTLARAGAGVVCLDGNEAFAVGCAREIDAAGGKAMGLGCDVTDEDLVGRAMKAAEAFGPVDILVNGAAIFVQKGIREISVAEWKRQIDILLTGTFLVTRAAVEPMIADGRHASIVNLISTVGHQGEPFNIAYATAKAGLLNFTRSLAMELAPYGIRVNSVTPTATSVTESVERAARWGVPGPTAAAIEFMDELAHRAPLDSLPGPSDYGAAVAFLCCDLAAHVTGIDLRVDAGTVAQYWRMSAAETRARAARGPA